MSYEITGKLIEKFDTSVISDKFKKREFILEKTENSNGFEFIDYIKIQLTQDKCSLIDAFEIGSSIKVSFNLRGRKWEKDGNTSYFTNIEAWRIEKDENSTASNTGEAGKTSLDSEPPMPEQDDFSASDKDQEFDDLPF